MPKPMIVLFSGAWFNQTRAHVEFCMQHVIRFFREHGYPIYIVTYRGNTFQEIAANCIAQLRDIPEGSIGVTYSTGSQIFRLVVNERQDLFKTGIIISGFGRYGMTLHGFWNGFNALRIPFIRGMWTGEVDIGNESHVWKFFFNGQFNLEGEPDVEEVIKAAHPELRRVCLQLAMPVIRKTLPPLPFKAVCVWPEEDILIPRPNFPNEDIRIVPVPYGGHGTILSERMIIPGLIGAQLRLTELGHIDNPGRTLIAL